VWRADTNAPIGCLRGHEDGVTCLLIYGSIVISGSYDKNVILYDFDFGGSIRLSAQERNSNRAQKGSRELSLDTEGTVVIGILVKGGLLFLNCLTLEKDDNNWLEECHQYRDLSRSYLTLSKGKVASAIQRTRKALSRRVEQRDPRGVH
ncbi:F-box/WD repeat-containing protein 7, partial [Taenia solium]